MDPKTSLTAKQQAEAARLVPADGCAEAMPFRMYVQADIQLFPVHWIATQTAKAVQEPLRSKHRDAMDKGEWLVTDIVKTGVFPDDLENLTPADWSHLSKAWADLPIFRLPMGREEFEPYRKAFESYLQPPPFDLDFAYGNGKLELGFQLEDAIDAHVEELGRWIDEGRVQQRTNISTLPTAGAWNSNTCLDFESLCKFARSLSVGVFVITPLDPMTKGQRLLGQFREAGGRLKNDGTPGVRGALEALARQEGKTRQAISEQLARADKAAKRKIAEVENPNPTAKETTTLETAWVRKPQRKQ